MNSSRAWPTASSALLFAFSRSPTSNDANGSSVFFHTLVSSFMLRFLALCAYSDRWSCFVLARLQGRKDGDRDEDVLWSSRKKMLESIAQGS
jgi:hypothetical protein